MSVWLDVWSASNAQAILPSGWSDHLKERVATGRGKFESWTELGTERESKVLGLNGAPGITFTIILTIKYRLLFMTTIITTDRERGSSITTFAVSQFVHLC